MSIVINKPIPFNGGIQLSPHKTIPLEQPLKKAQLPSLIKIPLNQNFEPHSSPTINIGDRVLKGQVIADVEGVVSKSVHATTSGIIKEIAEHLIPNSSLVKSICIVIAVDGNDQWIENREPIIDFYKLSRNKIQQKILKAGVIDSDFNLDINSLVLNATECEPYISCDEILMQYYAKEIITGAEILMYALQLDECVITIQNNKTVAINALQEALEINTKINIKLKLVSSLYMAGGEKKLIKSMTGVELAAKYLLVDVGTISYNVSTAVAVKKAIIDDEPLISRIVTITGPGIDQPRNLEVLLGTSISDVIEQCGGYNDQHEYLVMGGPIMGIRLFDDDVPVIKTTSCLLAANSQLDESKIRELSCICCKECASVCFIKQQPLQPYMYSKKSSILRLLSYHLFDCIDCGCCSYVCPSHFDLVDEYRQTKNRIWDERRNRLKANQNKRRYLNKQERMEKQRLDKHNKHSIMNAESALKKRKDEIKKAVNRVKIKRKIKNS